MRKIKFRKRMLQSDPRYNSLLVAQLINYVMEKGKKSLATKLVYQAMDKIEKKSKKDALEILQVSVKNTSPIMEVKTKRIGGATYQVPIEVRSNRRTALALKWIVQAAQNRQGKTFDTSLAEELLDAYKNSGGAIIKKENTHKAAHANKAFAHFARF